MGLPAGIRFLTNSARKKRGKERQRKLAQQQQQQQQQRGKKWKKGKGRGSALPEHVTRDGGRGASGGSDSTATLVGDERARSQSVPREQQEQGAAAKEEETVLEAAIEVEEEKEGASAAVEQSPVKEAEEAGKEEKEAGEDGEVEEEEEKSAADSKEEVQGNVLQSEVHVATETEEKENSPVKEAGEDSVPHTPQPGDLDRQNDAAADVELWEIEPSENGVAPDEPVENKAPAEDEPPENVDTQPQTPSKPTRTDVSRQAQEDMGMDFPTPPRSIVSRDSKERRPSEESMRCRAFAFQVVIETPCRTTPVASTPVSAGRVTRSSARKRVGEEVSTPQEAQTPVSRKRKRSELEVVSPYPFRARSRSEVLEDTGPEEPLTEVMVEPDVLITPEIATADEAPPPAKRRGRPRKAETVSPHFPTPTPSEEASVAKKPRKRTDTTKSPYFSGATETEKKGRAPKGISAIPWPPFTAQRFGLIQEELQEKPFHLLISTVFLNKTKGSVAKPILSRFLELYPTPEILSNASQEEVEELIRPLGLQRTRAERLVKMGKVWLANPPVADQGTVKYNYPPRNTRPFPIDGREPHGVVQKQQWEIGHIPGVGAYALDSWRIFCRDRLRGVEAGPGQDEAEEEWKRVVPNDKELRAYCRWRWAQEGQRWEEEGDGWGRAGASDGEGAESEKIMVET